MEEQRASSTRMTVAEFVHCDVGRDGRHELARGRPVAMSPPRWRHVHLVGNITQAPDGCLLRPRRPLQSDSAVCDMDGDEYLVSDAFVTEARVGEVGHGEPALIREARSPSIEHGDRAEKLDSCKSLGSVVAISLVWPDKTRIQLHLCEGPRCPAHEMSGAGDLKLPSISHLLTSDEFDADFDSLEAEVEE